MADVDFESGFNEIYGDVRENLLGPEGTTGNTPATENTNNTSHTGRRQHPFSVRLAEEYVTLIKAMAWWKRISQREFLEQAIEAWLNGCEEDFPAIMEQYENQ